MKNDPLSFCYWLQGFFELQEPEAITSEQLEMIKTHLDLVFEKVTEHPFRSLSKEEGFQHLNTPHTGLKSKGLCGMSDEFPDFEEPDKNEGKYC